MKRIDISKVAFVSVCVLTVLGVAFGFGLYSGAERTVVFKRILWVKRNVTDAFHLVYQEAPTLTKTHPDHFLQRSRYDGSGVTVNAFPQSNQDLILLCGFFDKGNELRLIRRNGDIVRRWPVTFSELFPDAGHMDRPPSTDWNIDLHGALALPDGSVVFNFEKGGLVKLDRDGNVEWTLARATHHSVERAEGGGFWVPGKTYYPAGGSSPFPPFVLPFDDDTIMLVSDEGEVVREESLTKILYDNGLEAVLTATGEWFFFDSKWDREILHLNKIEELPSSLAADFPMFSAGDLLLSVRARNLLLVMSPEDGRIKWWRIGPWLRQHDPEFIPGGRMIVFNNNTYPTEANALPQTQQAILSNIIEFDFASNAYRVIYGGVVGQELVTVFRGKHEPTPGGGLLITEFEGGRVFETDAAGRIVWEYINRYSDEEVAEITEARLYPPGYFNQGVWGSEEPGRP